MLTSKIARAVMRTIKLDHLAEEQGMQCDFGERWIVYAYNHPRVITNHQQSRVKDEQIMRKAA